MPFTSHIRRRREPSLINRIARPRATTVAYDPRQIAKAYNAPIDRCTGKGVTIGVIELGGALNSSDLRAVAPETFVAAVSVAGGQQRSDGPQGADGEVMLDVEIIARIAPGAMQRVYFAPNSEIGFLSAINQAVAECHVVSISWGGPESSWSSSSMTKFVSAFKAARAKGVPVFVAAGDAGSTDGTRSDVVDFPASAPDAIACGGTKLLLDADGARASEVTWDDDDRRSATGGGVSKAFPGRQVPDVAGNASPSTGYAITVDGEQDVVGGTSAVAPDYAACWALLYEATGGARYDFLNTIITNPTVCFDVTVGDNGGFKAGPGRDQTTGFGVVDFGKLLAVLTSSAPPPSTPAPSGAQPAPVPTAGAVPGRAFVASLRDQCNDYLGVSA